MSQDITEAIDDYCETEYGHTDWAWIDTVTKDELNAREHVIEGSVVIYIEKEKDSYRFGDFNPSVSARNYTGRGGHETWGSQR